MAEPADEMHVSLTDCRGRNHDGENSHEYSSPESPDSLGSLPELVDLEHSNFCAELADWAPNTENYHALIALQTAGSMENQPNTNFAELAIELSVRQSIMAAKLEWYKEMHEKRCGIGYYDAFKIQSDKKDIHANLTRLKVAMLAMFWDDVIGMWERHELPSDFQSRDRQTAITRLEFSRKRLHRGSFVTIPMICRFWESHGHNFDIKSLDPTEMTQEAYDKLVDVIKFFERHKLFLRTMRRCFIAQNTFLASRLRALTSRPRSRRSRPRSKTSLITMGIVRSSSTLTRRPALLRF